MERDFPAIETDPVQETTCIKCGHLMDVCNLPAFVQIACPECGTQQRVPGKMGAFLLVDLLGKGGMGAVFRGRDTGLDRWVAIKVMQSSFGGNPAFVDTFRKEAQAAAALNHPNIVQIYSFGVSHGQPFMAMELLEGGRLDQMIARNEWISEAVILKIGIDVAEGLNAAANISLIHGDVKPENILLDANGVAKVVDFGLARFKEQHDTGGTSKGIWGTPYYIAPEKLRGNPSDARSDIYSLGGTLFHALALKPPFDGETPMDVVKARLKHAAPILRSVRPGIHHEVEAIVGRMLDADPSRRYPNYSSALSDMRRVLALLGGSGPAPGMAGKKPGKIILSKKKEVTAQVTVPSIPAASGRISSRISRSLSANMSGSVSGRMRVVSTNSGPVPLPVPSPAKGSKTLLFVVLGICAVVGLVAAIVASQHASALRSAEEKERRQLSSSRKAMEAMWSEVQSIQQDVAGREAKARGWSSNAVQLVAAIQGAATQVPDVSEAAALSSNASACAAAVDRFLNESVGAVQQELKGLADQLETNRAAMAGLTNAASAALRVAAVTNCPARANELQKSLYAPEEQSRKAMEALDALKQKTEKALSELKAGAEKIAAEKAAAEKAAAEQAAADQAAAEKAAREQAEVKALEEARKANVLLLQQNQFKLVSDAIGQVAHGQKTEAGKLAGKQTLKAYQTLVDLKTLFIDGIHAEAKADPDRGYSYGWMKMADILGANEESIILRGGQRIAWSTVPMKQMLGFMQHYIADNNDLTARERATYQFAAALYIYDSAPGNENARKRATQYLADAVRGNAALGDLAKVVMPDLETR